MTRCSLTLASVFGSCFFHNTLIGYQSEREKIATVFRDQD